MCSHAPGQNPLACNPKTKPAANPTTQSCGCQVSNFRNLSLLGSFDGCGHRATELPENVFDTLSNCMYD
jgi:hypothetical protein